MLKIILKNHSKINDESMKKRMDFWTVLLVDFLSVFGTVLGAISALKINEKCIKQLSKVLVDFLMIF